MSASRTLLALLLPLSLSREAKAIRPFITDDARVVGGKLAQLESWWRRDDAAMQHWALFALGPTEELELTLGGVYGAGGLAEKPTFALGGPLVQAKYLFVPARKNGPPGVAVATGALPPLGRGGFETPGWSGFVYSAFTESLFDRELLLIHVNVGAFALKAPGFDPLAATWGIGAQLRTIGQFHLVGEIFSGDPYVASSGGAVQVGFRHIFSDRVQLDATVGTGVLGDVKLPVWATSGVRIVSSELW